ncbi:hypothetical protein L2089_15425 [Paenibacillus hunanensis]|uniref:hypothetical protein n=1 Tax=Paenibacillus hunanensis TaxID=539262 RepID=UPI0020268650|nr:hypothetical protein [Paenibacillus hunanensis]MCL9662084.1 hypothetical protein [Paenibacillus hunanensis]
MMSTFHIVVLMTIPLLILLVVGRSLNNKQKELIKKHGLIHFTHPKYADRILEEDIATIKSGSKLGSYSNFFVPSSFFFIGDIRAIKLWQMLFNFDLITYKEAHMTVIHIEEVDDLLLKRLRTRIIDGAVFVKGSVCKPARKNSFAINKQMRYSHLAVLLAMLLLGTLSIVPIIQLLNSI